MLSVSNISPVEGIVATVGGRTLARRNPTGTIPGNQAIEQPTNAYVNIRQ
jgi:hypothetical protein